MGIWQQKQGPSQLCAKLARIFNIFYKPLLARTNSCKMSVWMFILMSLRDKILIFQVLWCPSSSPCRAPGASSHLKVRTKVRFLSYIIYIGSSSFCFHIAISRCWCFNVSLIFLENIWKGVFSSLFFINSSHQMSVKHLVSSLHVLPQLILFCCIVFSFFRLWW